MAEETIFTNTDFTGGVFEEGSVLSLGTRFHVTEAGNAKRARFYCPPGGPGGDGTVLMRLYEATGPTLLATATFPSPTFDAWNETPWIVDGSPALVPLAINTIYSTSYVTQNRYGASTAYTWPKVSGGLRIESEAPGGFFGAGDTMPAGTFNNNNYYADCVVEFGAATSLVQQSFDLRWKTRALVQVSVDMPWKVRALVQASTDLRWKVRELVTTDVSLNWRVFSRVASDVDLRWRVYNAVTTSIDLRWKVYNSISQSFDMRWRTFGRTVADTSLPWRTYARVAASVDIPWRVYTSVAKDIDLRWRTYARVSSLCDVRWITYGRVYRDTSILWKTDGQTYTYSQPTFRANRVQGSFSAVRGPLPAFRINRP